MSDNDNSVGKIHLDLEINDKTSDGIDKAQKQLEGTCQKASDQISNSFSKAQKRIKDILGKTFEEAQKEINDFEIKSDTFEDLQDKCKTLEDKVKDYSEKCTQAVLDEINDGTSGASQKIEELLKMLESKLKEVQSMKDEIISNAETSLPAKSPNLDDTPNNNSPPDTSGIEEVKEKTEEAIKVNSEFEESIKRFTQPYEQAESAVDRLNQKLEVQYSKLAHDQQAVENIAKKYAELDSAELGSEAAQKLEQALYKAESQVLRDKDAIDKLESKVKELNYAVQDVKLSKELKSEVDKFTEAYTKAETPIERLNQKLDIQKSKLAMSQQEVAKIAREYAALNNKDLGSEKVQKLEQALKKAESQVLRDKDAVDKLNAELNKLSPKKINPIINAFEKTKNAVSKVGSVGKTAFSKLRGALKSTDKSAKQTSGLFGKLGKTVKGVFKATFITAALYTAFRGLKSLFSDAMEQSSDFQKSLNSLKANFKIAFQPVVSVVLPILTKLVNGLAQVMAKVASFISGVFGTTYEQSKEAAKAASETAKKSSEEAKKYLNSYDVMNVAEDTSSDSESSEDEGIDFDAVTTTGSKAAESLGAKFKKVMSELFTPIKNAWAKHGQPVLDAIKNTGSSIKSLFIDIGKDFKEIWLDGTGEALISSILKLVESLIRSVGKIADAFKKAWNQGDRGKKLIKSFITTFKNIIDLIAAISDSFGKAFDSPVGVSLIGHILDIIKNISDFVGNLAGKFTEAWNKAGLGDAIMQNLFGVLDSIFGTVDTITEAFAKWAGELDFTPLLESLNGLLEAFQPLVDVLGGALADAFENVLLPLGKWGFEEALPEALDMVSGAFEMLGSIIDAIKPGVEYFFEKVLKPIGEWTGKLIIETLGKLKELFKKVADVFKEKGDKITNILEGISDAFAWVWDMIKPVLDAAKGVITTVIDTIGDIIGPVIDALSGLVDFIAGVFSGDWERAWNGIKDFIGGIWDAIWGIIKGVINLIIDAINTVWSLLYKVFSTIVNIIGGIAGFIGDIFGCDWDFSMPEDPPLIPKLAKGGLVSAPTLAMVGDNPNASSDPEVVAPLSKLEKIMGSDSSEDQKKIISLLEEIIELLKALDFTFNGQIDGKTLFEFIVDFNRKNTKNTGVNALV